MACRFKNGNYRNPVLYADYSDPDAIRVGDDYFMISSSFCNAPALPVLHSKDLVNWKVVNYVWTRFLNSDTEILFMAVVCGHLQSVIMRVHIMYVSLCLMREFI